MYCAWWPASGKSLPSGELVIFLKTSGTWLFISHHSLQTLLCFFTNIIIPKQQVQVNVPAVWVQSSPSVLSGSGCGDAYRRLQETGQWHRAVSGPGQPPDTLRLHETVGWRQRWTGVFSRNVCCEISRLRLGMREISLSRSPSLRMSQIPLPQNRSYFALRVESVKSEAPVHSAAFRCPLF